MQTYETVLDALGDPTRRQIVAALRRGPRSVAEVAHAVPVSRPAVSQHLRVLKDSGLVAFDSVGTKNVYRLRPDGLAELRDWLDGFWDLPLDEFARYATRTSKRTNKNKRGSR